MSKLSWLFGKKYFEGGVSKARRDLSNKVVVVTGSSSGIGRETAKGLAAQNATVVMANRNEAKTQPILDDMIKQTGNPNIEFIKLDIADLSSVRDFVKTFKQRHDRLDVLVNNAGIASVGSKPTFTKDGLESQMGGNYLGHFYLTNLLANTLKNTQQSRVINVLTKSCTYKRLNFDDLMSEKKYDAFESLVQSKVATLMFAQELQQRLGETNTKVMSLHPGWVRSEGLENLKNEKDRSFFSKASLSALSVGLLYFGKDSRQGAQTGIHCSLEDFNKLKSGGFYSDCEEYSYKPTEDLNEQNRRKLWEWSEKIIKEKLGNDAFEVK